MLLEAMFFCGSNFLHFGNKVFEKKWILLNIEILKKVAEI
jgi:hypothetical protein